MAKFVAAAFVGVAAWAGFMTPPGANPGAGTAKAADHADAPNVDNDAGADIADVFLFLDPNDNTKVCILGTVHGFIVPGEAANLAAFDPNVLYRFDIENTGDAKADTTITVQFSERKAASDPQLATVHLPGKKTFTAPTTPASLATQPTTQAVTLNANNTGVDFFAGEVDDPFFFDIPAFNRFVASVRAGAPDVTKLERGRDTFAGYNILGIAMRMPVSMIQATPGRAGPTTNRVGVEFITSRKSQAVGKNGVIKASGKFRQVDRTANPAVNVALIPFSRKSEHNGSTPADDAKGKFASDIVATLTAFGTDAAHQKALADVVITNGDFLRFDPSIPNTGPGGGDNIPAQYPNGRRLKDDTIDITLTLIANQDPTTRPFALGDHVDASDVPPQDTFPFFALPQQPRDPGVIDDNTRN